MKSQLKTTRKNAAEDIFNRNNSAGNMGKVDAHGRLCIDFHGLYVRDAIEKYKDMVLPILPVQMECAIITGRGKHALNGRSVLRDGLIEHIHHSVEARSGKIKSEIDKRNKGIIVLRWIGKNKMASTLS